MRRALLLSTALLLTACGGDDGGDSGPTAKEAFVSDATAICEQAATKKDALVFPTTAAEFSPYADALVGLAEQAQTDLSALEPPEPDREALQTRVLDPFAAVVEEGRAFAEQVRAAGADQAKLLPLLSSLPDAGDVDLQYLRSYGLGTCADVIDTAG